MSLLQNQKYYPLMSARMSNLLITCLLITWLNEILKFSAVLKFPADDLQFPVIVFSLWKHSNVIFNYNNYYLLIINYYYNNNYEKSQ